MLQPVRIFLQGTITAAILGAIFVVGHTALAQTTFSIESIGSRIGLGNADLVKTVINIIKWFLGFVTLAAVAYMIYGGYLWLTSAGDEKRVEKAKQTILQAAIGLVIILLSWAIVLFIARTAGQVSGNGGGGGGTPTCNPAVEDCTGGGASTFDLTAVTTCAARPNYNQNVPLSSAVALSFNTKLDTSTVEAAIIDATTAPNLEIQKCTDPTCTSFVAPQPPPINNQVYSGDKAKGAIDSTKAEWVARFNTLTFYHLSFSTDLTDKNNRYFEPTTTYRVIIPKSGASTAIKDIRGRALEFCRRQATLPIEGDDLIGSNCTVDPATDTIYWTFTTGTDANGPDITVNSTVPTAQYLTNSQKTPDRNVSLRPVLAIDFSGAIDPNSLGPDNFQIFKFTNPPDPVTGQGGTTSPTPLGASQVAYLSNMTGTGGYLQPNNNLEPFTWYKVVVGDVHNLCGRVQQQNPYSWVFETNDTIPGVKQVYPTNNFKFACPATEVFIQFKTSMWNVAGGSFDCQAGSTGSFVTTTGGMSPNAGRALRVVDQYNPADPNNSCKKYAFTPTSIGLRPGQTYSVGVNTNLTININGTDKLNYGDSPPAASPSQGPWSFTVTTADKCVQPPYIDHVSPRQGKDGQCISVVGNYFEKQIGAGPREADGQNAGDTLKLDAINQDPIDAWTNNAVVTNVTAGTLTTNQNHDFKVTVNYPAPIGPVSSLAEPWRLNDANGNTSQGPCLVSLSKTAGPEGTNLSASGKRFGPGGGQSKVPYTGYSGGPSWQFDSATWASDGTKVGSITVSPGSTVGDGDVTVIDNAGNESNGLPFTVTPLPVTPPGQGTGPQVEESTLCDANAGSIPSPNPKKNDTQACINSWPSARFVGAMNISTLTTGPGGNIILEQCDAAYATCTVVPTTLAVSATTFQLKTSANLLPSTNYRVTIGTGVQNLANVPLTAPYVWKFKTKAGNATCPIAAVVINTSNQTFGSPYDQSNPFNQDLPAVVTDTACNTVSGTGLNYAWTNSDPLVCRLLTNYTGQTNRCTGPVDEQHLAATNVKVATEGKTSNTIKISYDPTSCRTNADCGQNNLGQACNSGTADPADDSKCVNNRCTPVVNAVDPNSGKIGTWTTVQGCWFGPYQSGISKVMFADRKEGLAPDSLICGSPAATWTNEWIVREVPNATTPADVTDDAVTGPVQVVRFDSLTATGPAFTVNTQIHPKLCKVNPNQGVPTAAPINLSGKDFGPTRETPAQDVIKFTNNTAGSATDATSYPTWTDTSATTAVPGTAAFGVSTVHLLNNAVPSNGLPFKVLDPSAVGGGAGVCPTTPIDLRCSFGDDSTCPAGLGCGFSNCCQQKPKIVSNSWKPPPAAKNICRNTQVQVSFDQPLFGTSVNNSTVTYLDGAKSVNGTVSLKNTATTGTVSYEPGLLTANADQQLTLQLPIRSKNGVMADLTGSPLRFKTGPDICVMNRVVIDPPSHRFFQANQAFFPYSAEAWPTGSNTPLAQINGVYTWSWTWTIADNTLATVTNDAPPYPSVSQQTVQSKAKSGSTTVQAKAQVTTNQSKPGDPTQKSGQADVVVDICDNPWLVGGQPGFSDSAANCTAGGACTDFHFNLNYCLGQGSTNLLPSFAYQAIEGTKNPDPAPLKSFFFKEGADTRDVIGLLIFDNPDFLSPYDWYRQRFPLDTGGSSATVAGYPALKTGTTTYIGVTNFDGANLHGVMVVLDFNSNSAQASTKNVYNQFLNKLQFNTNMNGTDAQRVIRDTKRKQDIANISLLVESYKSENGGYPDLAAGSYIIGMSTSLWPSWQNTFGNTVGRAVPLDPLNGFSPECKSPEVPAGDGYEARTCWSEPKKTFHCPADSHLYLFETSGGNYGIYGQMEYDGTGKFATGSYNPCTSPNTCSCFNYKLGSASGAWVKPPARKL